MLARWKGRQVSLIIREREQFTRAKIRQQTTLGRFRKQKLDFGRHLLAVDGETAHSLFTVPGGCQFASAHFQFKGFSCLYTKTFS